MAGVFDGLSDTAKEQARTAYTRLGGPAQPIRRLAELATRLSMGSLRQLGLRGESLPVQRLKSQGRCLATISSLSWPILSGHPREHSLYPLGQRSSKPGLDTR